MLEILKNKIKANYLFFYITAIIVLIFYIHTLNYPWKHFDEQIIYNETIVPIPSSISQIFEYIKYFGLNHYFEASNPFYSSISNLRSVPFNNLITMFVHCFFQKNPFLYHLLSLFLHIINTLLLFILIYIISTNYIKENMISNNFRLLLITTITLLWSLHPVNVEPVLFTTNWSAVLTTTLCLILIHFYVRDKAKGSFLNYFFPFVLFLMLIFICEFPIFLPLIIFFYIFANQQFYSPSSTPISSLKIAFKKTTPLLIAFGIYACFFLSSPIRENLLFTEDLLTINLERIFWFSPQIFFHFIKLILFPFHLSVDQTSMVKLGDSLTSPYSIFCSIFMCCFILSLLISLFFLKKRWAYLFFISLFPFILALSPYLHIISPTYCLMSERYLYFPLLILTFSASNFIFFVVSNSSILKNKILAGVLILIFSVFSLRTYFRTYDWKDSLTLYTSALKETQNELFKGLRMAMLGSILLSYYGDNESQIKGKNYLLNAIKILEELLDRDEKESKSPKIIMFYGLDSKTIQAKTAYLLAFTRLGIESDFNKAYELLKPHMQDLSITDTQILDLYLGLLFAFKNYDEAEKILNNARQKSLSPTVLIIFSELYKRKYNDYLTAEKYLKESFKLFSYDPQTIAALKQLYFETNNAHEFAFFAYLHGIRSHSSQSLNESYKVYSELKNEKMASSVQRALNLLVNK